MLCPKCGVPVDEETGKCPQCGEVPSSPEENETTAESQETVEIPEEQTVSSVSEPVTIVPDDGGKAKKKKWIIAGAAVILVGAGIYLSTTYLLPNHYISKVEEAYAAKDYAAVASYEDKLDSMEKVSDDFKDLEYKVYYSKGMELFEAKDYDGACKALESVERTKDVSKVLNDAYYNLAKENYKDKKYAKAYSYLNKVDGSGFKGYDSLKKGIHYEMGKVSLGKKDFDKAVELLEPLKDYKDVSKYLDDAYFGKAEMMVRGSSENDWEVWEEALIEFKKLSADNETSALRKKQLNTVLGYKNAVGEKPATKTYAEVRNVWNYDGRWDSWFINEVNDEEIDTKITLNDDGTFDLNGEASFYSFNDYSSLSEYCQANFDLRLIEMKNITQIPGQFIIDDNTKLFYANGKFSLKYSLRDDYSVNFHNIYSTSITY